uniref:MADS-box protein-like mRNA n=1 Tax=Cymbidium goeringii TaxID=112607 RepID=A0A455LA60_9ASPA|nr:MADS-box protein-like mRNA [Cymbidium goeringii]
MIMTGKGRKRVENKLIENPSSRMVCFSKRRKGLFKKAEELSILSGAKVTAPTFSQAGKAYCSDFQTLDSLLCPQVSISSEEDGRESASAEAVAADSLVCPQLGMFVEKKAEKYTLGSAFAEAVASDSLLCRSFDMSAEQADFAEDMIQELY